MQECGVVPHWIGLKIKEEVPVFPFTQGVLLLPEIVTELYQTGQGTGETIGEHPAFPIAIGHVEPRDMVNDAHPSHFTSDSLKHA